MMNKIMTFIWIAIFIVGFMFFAYGALHLDPLILKKSLLVCLAGFVSVFILYVKHGSSNFMSVLIHGGFTVYFLASFVEALVTNNASKILIYLACWLICIGTIMGLEHND